jgi:hypothetical protein
VHAEAAAPAASPGALTPAEYEPVDRRTVHVAGLAILVGVAA